MKANIRRALTCLAAVLVAAPASNYALPNITSVVETGGDNEATDTITAKFTGETFSNGVAGEYQTPFTVPIFGEGVPSMVDRVHHYTQANATTPLPRYLLGGEYIMIGNDNKDNAGFYLAVTIEEPSMVYLLIDNRTGGTGNGNPPLLEGTTMQWVLDYGWTPVVTGVKRSSNETFPDDPDEVGNDEGADGNGPGVGVNNWYSVYGRFVEAGTFELFNDANGGNMYGVVIKSVAPAPRFVAGTGNLLGFTASIEEGAQTQLDEESISLKLDGDTVEVSSATVDEDGFWSIQYNAPAWFESESVHDVEIVFSDDGVPATKFTNSFSFTADRYPTLTAAHAIGAGSVDTSSSGFTARITQFRDAAGWPGNDLPNNTQRAEAQLAGRLIDPITGELAENYAVPNPEAGSGGLYTLPIINLNDAFNGQFPTMIEAGSFTSATEVPVADQGFPGIPGTDPNNSDNTDNMAGEFMGYLQLEPGLYLFGVNSDDGFRVTAGKDPRSPEAVELGVYSGGRGPTDSLFYVEVAEAGIYPVRLIWYDGGGGGALEFFSQDWETGEKVLINDRDNGGIVSYSEGTAPTLSVSATPLAGATGVTPRATIQAQVFENGTTLATDSVTLTVNGEEVETEVSREGNVATILFRPTENLDAGANEVVLTFSDTQSSAVEYTHSWSFSVVDYSGWVVVPSNYAVPSSSIDLDSSGFLVDTYQMTDGFSIVARSGFSNNNSVEAAEHQINRGFLDFNSGEPFPNTAYEGFEDGGRHLVEYINFSQDQVNAATFNSGNGYAENPIPGLDPGAQDWVVSEFVTYLELSAGHHQFIVNCDDGFVLTTAPDPDEPGASIRLGIRSPGGGSTDTFVNIFVEEAGFYPIRLLWWEGTGGANCEFTYVHPESGARVLVNDRTRAGTVKAYPTYTGPERGIPSVSLTAPENNEHIEEENSTITLSASAEVENATIAKVEFFVGGAKVGEDSSAPYSVEWADVAAGRYEISARATDSNGFVGESETVWILVGTPVVSVNFQTLGSTTPDGFVPDVGYVFGDQGFGFNYGWDADNTANTRDRNLANSPDEWHDTLTHSQRPPAGTIWEIELPNGTYKVYGAGGDAGFFDSVIDYQVEGTQWLQGAATTDERFVRGSAIVTVTDGRLTVTNGPGASNNKLNFIDIFESDEVVEEPEITSITRDGNSITVTWTGGGALQATSSLTPPVQWTEASTSGTHTENASTGDKFFRVVR